MQGGDIVMIFLLTLFDVVQMRLYSTLYHRINALPPVLLKKSPYPVLPTASRNSENSYVVIENTSNYGLLHASWPLIPSQHYRERSFDRKFYRKGWNVICET